MTLKNGQELKKEKKLCKVSLGTSNNKTLDIVSKLKLRFRNFEDAEDFMMRLLLESLEVNWVALHAIDPS